MLESKGTYAYRLAAGANLPKQTVQSWAAGERNFSNANFRLVYRVAKGLNMTMEELFDTLDDCQCDDLILAEGWNDISDDFSIYVENGIDIKGIERSKLGDKTVYPYLSGGSEPTKLDNGIPVKRYREEIKKRKSDLDVI